MSWEKEVEDYLSYCMDSHEHTDTEDVKACIVSALQEKLEKLAIGWREGSMEYVWTHEKEEAARLEKWDEDHKG